MWFPGQHFNINTAIGLLMSTFWTRSKLVAYRETSDCSISQGNTVITYYAAHNRLWLRDWNKLGGSVVYGSAILAACTGGLTHLRCQPSIAVRVSYSVAAGNAIGHSTSIDAGLLEWVEIKRGLNESLFFNLTPIFDVVYRPTVIAFISRVDYLQHS